MIWKDILENALELERKLQFDFVGYKASSLCKECCLEIEVESKTFRVLQSIPLKGFWKMLLE